MFVRFKIIAPLTMISSLGMTMSEGNQQNNDSEIDWDAVVFEVELLKSQEINLDYILELILETNQKVSDKDRLIEEITRTIRATLGQRAKESLIVDFINVSDLDSFSEKSDILENFIHLPVKNKKKQWLI